MNDFDELRALVREVIRDVLPRGLPVTETVNLSTDEDLAAFVKRLLELDPDQREELRIRPETVQAGDGPGPAGSDPEPRPRHRCRGRRSDDRQSGSRCLAGTPHRARRGDRGDDQAAARAGERLVLGRGAVLTPLARDRARASGVQIEKER